MLIVGCGCRGRELATELLEQGHAVRGTTRRPEQAAAIDSAGAEPVVADPDRLATLLPAIEGVSAICWLLGSATGPRNAVAALHGARLTSLLERLVDSPLRGFVYEATGSLEASLLESGAGAVRGAGERFRLPVAFVRADPRDRAGWLEQAAAAVSAVLEPRC